MDYHEEIQHHDDAHLLISSLCWQGRILFLKCYRFLNKLDDNCRSKTNFSQYVNYAQIPTALYSSCRFLCIELRPIMSYTRKITDITAIKRNYFSQPTVLVSVYFLCHKNCSFLYIIITTGIHIIIALLCIVQIQTG